MLIRNATTVLTGIADSPRLASVDIRIEGAVIAAIGTLRPEPGEETLDAGGCVVTPGWVNVHHHFFQSLLKAVPAGLAVPLSEWSPAVSLRFRGGFTEDVFRTATRVALAELALSGCTTTVDHNFLYYAGQDFDSSAILFEEAARFGLRFALCRGGMTRKPAGRASLPPWLVPETIDAYVADLERLAHRFHDASPRSMRRGVVAPTTLTGRVERGHLSILSATARRLGLRMHSHLAETRDDEAYCQAAYGIGVLDLCEETGWCGPDVWFAHMVKLTSHMMDRVGAWGVGLAHCPASNARLGAGVAPVRELERRGVRIGIGVDGAGSNEAADRLSELHFAWLVHRAQAGACDRGLATAPSAEELIRWATAGGAGLLGLETGCIAEGWPADLVVHDPVDIGHAGLHDPAAALVVAGARPRVKLALANGVAIVREGELAGIDIDELRADAARDLHRLVDRCA